jgi:hypothetical protein
MCASTLASCSAQTSCIGFSCPLRSPHASSRRQTYPGNHLEIRSEVNLFPSHQHSSPLESVSLRRLHGVKDSSEHFQLQSHTAFEWQSAFFSPRGAQRRGPVAVNGSASNGVPYCFSFNGNKLQRLSNRLAEVYFRPKKRPFSSLQGFLDRFLRC